MARHDRVLYNSGAALPVDADLAPWRGRHRSAPLSPLAVLLLAAAGMTVATATEISGPVLIAIVLGSYLHRCLLPQSAASNACPCVDPRRDCDRNRDRGAGAGKCGAHACHGNRPGPRVACRDGAADGGRACRPVPGSTADKSGARGLAHCSRAASCRLTIELRATCRPRPARALVWLPLGTAMIAIYGSLWIGQVATGKLLEQRGLNYLHFVLVGGLSLTAIAAGAASGERLWGMIAARWPSLEPHQARGRSLAAHARDAALPPGRADPSGRRPAASAGGRTFRPARRRQGSGGTDCSIGPSSCRRHRSPTPHGSPIRSAPTPTHGRTHAWRATRGCVRSRLRRRE